MGTTYSLVKPPGASESALHAAQLMRHQVFFFPLCLVLALSGVEVSKAAGLAQTQVNLIGQDNVELQQKNMTPLNEIEPRDPLDGHIKDEVHCLALNIYFEARSEPAAGRRAVGHVVMNRVAHPAFPDSVCKVVQQGGEEVLHRCQFSWWCDGRSDRPGNKTAWNESLRLAWEIYLGLAKDTTDGALWYHATYVKPYWSDILLPGDRIGQHIFYLENERSRKTL